MRAYDVNLFIFKTLWRTYYVHSANIFCGLAPEYFTAWKVVGKTFPNDHWQLKFQIMRINIELFPLNRQQNQTIALFVCAGLLL